MCSDACVQRYPCSNMNVYCMTSRIPPTCGVLQVQTSSTTQVHLSNRALAPGQRLLHIPARQQQKWVPGLQLLCSPASKYGLSYQLSRGLAYGSELSACITSAPATTCSHTAAQSQHHPHHGIVQPSLIKYSYSHSVMLFSQEMVCISLSST
jgi:hypothetical protein